MKSTSAAGASQRDFEDQRARLAVPEGGTVDHELEVVVDAEALEVALGVARKVKIGDHAHAARAVPVRQHLGGARGEAQVGLVFGMPAVEQALNDGADSFGRQAAQAVERACQARRKQHLGVVTGVDRTGESVRGQEFVARLRRALLDGEIRQ